MGPLHVIVDVISLCGALQGFTSQVNILIPAASMSHVCRFSFLVGVAYPRFAVVYQKTQYLCHVFSHPCVHDQPVMLSLLSRT